MRFFLTRILPFLIAILLLVFALRNVSFVDIGSQFRRANYIFLGPIVLITLLSVLVRGKRWQQPLLALGYKPTAFRTTVAMQAGAMAGMIVVGSGELTRCGTLLRTDGIPIPESIGSVVAERVVDLTMVFVLLLLTALVEFDRIKIYFFGLTLAIPFGGYWLSGIVAGLGILILVLVWWGWQQPTIRLHPIVIKLSGILSGLGLGFMAIRQLPNVSLFVGLTLLLQVLGLSATYLLLLACDVTQAVPLSSALTIMAVGGVGSLLVPTQGGVGTYHFLIGRVLGLYGIASIDAAAAATFMHAMSFAIVLLISAVGLLLVPVITRFR